MLLEEIKTWRLQYGEQLRPKVTVISAEETVTSEVCSAELAVLLARVFTV